MSIGRPVGRMLIWNPQTFSVQKCWFKDGPTGKKRRQIDTVYRGRSEIEVALNWTPPSESEYFSR